MYTIYVRKSIGSNGERYIVSVPAINFDFGYNSTEKLLKDWEIELKE
ncbi:MAG: hypothetical protein K6G60_04850 [Lachnospiraceae bacterium]|nr:hypothetical protein [Lachnospiraceae bacterium]